MGLTKSSRFKRTKTGAKKTINCKKRKHHLAREPTNSKIGDLRLQRVRARGGTIKTRALRINAGNFACRSHNFVVPAHFDEIVYHPSSNELMRTNTVTKGAIVKIDAKVVKERFVDILEKDQSLLDMDPPFFKNLENGKLYGIIASRPGQCGRADGYILQGAELAFYLEKLKKRNK